MNTSKNPKKGSDQGSKMSKEDARRIQSAGDSNHDSKSHKTGFPERAQHAADKREHQQKQNHQK